MIDWQPMESAPLDGTKVLLWIGGVVFAARWVDDSHGVKSLAWIDEDGDVVHQPHCDDDSPTHWAVINSPDTPGAEAPLRPLTIVDAMLLTGLARNRADAARFIAQGAVSLNGLKVPTVNYVVKSGENSIEVGNTKSARINLSPA